MWRVRWISSQLSFSTRGLWCNRSLFRRNNALSNHVERVWISFWMQRQIYWSCWLVEQYHHFFLLFISHNFWYPKCAAHFAWIAAFLLTFEFLISRRTETISAVYYLHGFGFHWQRQQTHAHLSWLAFCFCLFAIQLEHLRFVISIWIRMSFILAIIFYSDINNWIWNVVFLANDYFRLCHNWNSHRKKLNVHVSLMYKI